MITQVAILIVTVICLLLIDYYFFVAVKFAFKQKSNKVKRFIQWSYWLWTALILLLLVAFNISNQPKLWFIPRSAVMVLFFMHYFSKLLGVIVLMFEDIWRGLKWTVQAVIRFFNKGNKQVAHDKSSNTLSRADFIAKSTLLAATIPFVTMSYGIISGAHDYRIRRKTIRLKNLPKAFDGIKIGQLSDIHSGSFFNKTAVKGGVEMLLNEKPDLIMFTGDLVNTEAKEVHEYFDIFGKLTAPMGVYSVLGNHDYGEYKQWGSEEAKKANFQSMLDAHKALGWKLLLNEHHDITLSGDKISILGVENWGSGRFPKYGKLDEAHLGTEEASVKILLSHDPSHWDAQILPMYHDIDLTLSGHTHGFQFGVEWGNIKWSPSQYVYKQWAGHYQSGEQHLYVNRGFGYIGYPGRIGIPPEITIITLEKA
jgi:uncharacterized protein